MLTWGDGVSNVNLTDLLKFHRRHGRIATVTAVRPPARFGRLELDGERVARFDEKPLAGEAWINGAFFVLEPRVFDYIEGDDTLFEREPLESLARDGAAHGLSAPRLLAVHGHHARQSPSRVAVGERRCALEDLAMSED